MMKLMFLISDCSVIGHVTFRQWVLKNKNGLHLCGTISIYLAIPVNVNMKHYRSLSNLGLVGPLIRFWQPKQLPVDTANNKPHTWPHHVVNNAHPFILNPYAQFQPD